jgi:glycosyltransferase involved in cell wall biosynthesis
MKTINLYFVSYRISLPLTGGEKCTFALIEGARKLGLAVHLWEAHQLPRLLQNIIILNIMFLFRCILLPKNSFLAFNTDFHSRSLFAILFAKYVKKTRIIGILYHYNYWDKESKIGRKAHLILEKTFSLCFDSLITISQFSYNNFRLLTKKEIKNSIITPFVKTTSNEKPERHSISLQSPHLLYVGTIEPRKNIENSLSALATVPQSFTFDIIGGYASKRYFDQLQEFSMKMKSASSVLFHGRQESRHLEDFFRKASIFILVSRMEGYGMVYAEAMKYGLPIIGTTKGAVPELVTHGENGILCDPDDVPGIARAITSLCDLTEWNRISHNNLRKFDSLTDRETFVEASRKVFEDLIGQNRC